jgi:Flp pilus assembly protein TadG
MNLRGEGGDLLVEFAITMPLLVMVLTGTASFAVAFYNLQQLGNATATAVQYVAATQGLTYTSGSDKGQDIDPCAAAQAQVTGALPAWIANNFSYALVVTDSSGTTHRYPSTGMTPGAFSCTGGATEEATNGTVVLTVQYSYAWLPILAFSPTTPLTSTQAAIAE